MNAQRTLTRKDIRHTLNWLAYQAWANLRTDRPDLALNANRIYTDNRPIVDPETGIPKELEPALPGADDARDSFALCAMRGISALRGPVGGAAFRQIEYRAAYIVEVRTAAAVPYGLDVNDDITTAFEDEFILADPLVSYQQALAELNGSRQPDATDYIHPAVDFNLEITSVDVKETGADGNWFLSLVEILLRYDRTSKKEI